MSIKAPSESLAGRAYTVGCVGLRATGPGMGGPRGSGDVPEAPGSERELGASLVAQLLATAVVPLCLPLAASRAARGARAGIQAAWLGVSGV